jgi:hypothetical protein
MRESDAASWMHSSLERTMADGGKQACANQTGIALSLRALRERAPTPPSARCDRLGYPPSCSWLERLGSGGASTGYRPVTEAERRQFDPMAPPVVLEEEFDLTYSPGISGRSRSRDLSVMPGEELSGIDIVMGTSRAPAVRPSPARGRVAGARESAPACTASTTRRCRGNGALLPCRTSRFRGSQT